MKTTLTKLEILEAKVNAIYKLKDEIERLNQYEITEASEDYELDKYDIKHNEETKQKIRGLTYIIDLISGE